MVTSAPRVLAVIPARGGSKGLPGKNIRPLAGLPLIAHSIAAARMVPSVTRCVVSTDSEEIAEVARAHGGDVPFLRPAELAADETPMAPVLRHCLETVEALEGQRYDALLLVDPTSPARDPEQIEAAIAQLLASENLDGVISVSQPTFNPTWVGVKPSAEDASVLQRYYEVGTGITRRQDAERFLRINGNFYVWRREFVLGLEDSWFDEGRHGMVEIPEAQAFAIDYAYEFDLLEALVAQGFVQLPWLTADAAGATGARGPAGRPARA
ncbi:cytidylyltransferase domain-containing protein [Nostocoides sp. HKS02]|uniref:acylneuraminate cytidylyltransferase family protein n=1 Tax=Nostocoides sp. HKS02 TaxID=1813880 RepID=UPI0012B4AD37|nr:acylneuraminate cytidylyltransferase family protein [Tetrasphaera sp. HKS02]QGN56646.1 acylneuraminate cytidylyltransferase family protein [Tetrasphaera sp. HKS02]